MQDDQQPNMLDERMEVPATTPDDAGAGLPPDIILSMLRLDELEKLRNYVNAYFVKHSRSAA